METAEYICVNVGGSLVGSYRKAAVHSLHIVYQLVRSVKNEFCFISLKRGSDADWMERHHTLKACV